MNKIISYAFFGAIVIVTLASCKKNNLVLGKDITAPAFVKIGTWPNADTTGSYIVRSNNAPFKIPIGITNLSDKDRTINFSYSSATAVEGVNYTAPKSIIIKAGQSLDSLEITGLFAGFNNDVTKTLNLKVTISGGDVPINAVKFNYVVTMKMYWDADVNAYSGTYISQDYKAGVLTGDPYEVELIPASGNGPQTYVNIKGLGKRSELVRIVLNWTDRTKGTTTIPKAFFYDNTVYGPLTINPNGTGKFSATAKTMTIGYENTVSAGSFGKFTSDLIKK
ncbi:MAG: hypothetical protein ABIW47_11275 [Ginsengibacter sp.]